MFSIFSKPGAIVPVVEKPQTEFGFDVSVLPAVPLSEAKGEEVIVYCDGSCSPNPGVGGFGFTDLKGNIGYGREEVSTNQRMELKAAIEAVKVMYVPSRTLKIITDSKYVMKGISEWVFGWERKGWTTSTGEPVANLELWKELRDLTRGNAIAFEWVKGHSGNEGNEEADRLANLAMRGDVVDAFETRRRDPLILTSESGLLLPTELQVNDLVKKTGKSNRKCFGKLVEELNKKESS